jgi:hemolysin activation/secretion protein
VELAGQSNLLSAGAQAELLGLLREGGARRLSEQDLSALLQKAQQSLDAKLPQRFVLSIPAQTMQDQTLSVLVQPRLVQLSVQGSAEFDEANVRASLPSLAQGQALGATWVDLRELQMANDNPLKLTTVDFPVQPDQGVSANVKAVSPLGSTQWTVGLSNTGNDTAGRNQVQLNAVNANLTGQDDVLSLSSGASLKSFGDVGFVALRYSLPDYAGHVTRSVNFTHIKGDINAPLFSLGLSSLARYNELGYRQTHYLGDVAGVLNAAKLSVGASYVASTSDTLVGNVSLLKTDLKVLPVAASLEASFPMAAQNRANMRVEVLASHAGWTGEAQKQEWLAARSGADSSYSMLRLNLNGSLDLSGYGALAWQYNGQYSAQKLLPLVQFSAANPFTGVRGFVNTGVAGDSGQVLRLELQSANVAEGFDARGYVFYDAGLKQGGSDERNVSLSSAGVGVRLGSSDSRIKVDAFAAAKGQGHALDLSSSGVSQKDRTSAWLMASYSF